MTSNSYRGLSGAALFTRVFDNVMIREDLLSQDEARQFNALQQVIAYITVGKDMSGVFNEVAPLCSSPNLTIKRLVYLYLLDNGRVQPEKAVLQAGTFVKDSLHDSSLIRAAALRTLTSLQLPVMTDFAIAPLKRCLADSDAYVRRVAAFGVLKLYSVSPSACQESGILMKLTDQLKDSSSYVLAGCVQVILELIHRGVPVNIGEELCANQGALVGKLSEANGWSICYLLEAISYTFVYGSIPLETQETAAMSVLPYIWCTNSAIVLSAVKALSNFILHALTKASSSVGRERLERTIGPYIAQCLVSQLNSPRDEIKYLILRSVELFYTTPLMRYFVKHLGAFFIRPDDAIYVQIEKLEVLVLLGNEENGREVLSELAVYALSPDLELSKKSVTSIGSLAANIQSLSPMCVDSLAKLIQTGVSHIVQDSAIVVQTILRRYPNQFSHVIKTLCDALCVLESSESKAAVAWVVGEYCNSNHIEDPYSILSVFYDDFFQLPPTVQLTVLTLAVKIYLKSSTDHEKETNLANLEEILGACTHSTNPDLRDRAFFYWRLVTANPKVAANILLAPQKNVLTTPPFDSHARSKFIENIGTFSSVVQQPLEKLLGTDAVTAATRDISDDDSDDAVTGDEASGLASPLQISNGEKKEKSPSFTSNIPLLMTPALSVEKNQQEKLLNYIIVLSTEAGRGISVKMAWSQLGNKLVLKCIFELHKGIDYVENASITQLQIDTNMFSLGVAQVFPTTNLTSTNSLKEVGLILGTNNGKKPTRDIHVALQIDPIGISYFLAPPVPSELLLLPATGCDLDFFINALKEFPIPSWTLPPQISPIRTDQSHLSVNALRVHCLNLVYSNTPVLETKNFDIPAQGLFLSATTISGLNIFFEVAIQEGIVIMLSAFCKDISISAVFGEYVARAISV